MRLFINPGSGPVAGATATEARKNIKQFVTDLNLDGVTIRRRSADDYNNEYQDGRFCFLLRREGRTSEIQMPGLPLERVRYMGEPDQNIWNFPRLYESDSSWIWLFALNNARLTLTQDPEDD